MSKYHDDNTYASHPGGLRLSPAKLAALEPELFTDRTFRCSPGCPIDHPAAEMRERFAEHLQLGDSRAALVVSVTPLVVAAYSSDLDAVVLLSFPAEFVGRYRLVAGSRLLTVNTYIDVCESGTGKRRYAVDLIPGPHRSGWSGFCPFIADFLSDDVQRIEARNREIDEEEWADAARLAQLRIDRWGLNTARPGKPSLAGTPIRIWGTSPYRPFAEFSYAPAKGDAGCLMGAIKMILFALSVLVAIAALR